MTAQDYPVTTPWGYSADYPLNGGRHRGEDRYMPVGTPVVVNGVCIGLSGDTGYVTGPHLHIGEWINGVDVNPSGGGFSLDAPKVVGINTNPAADTLNGRWVQLRDSSGVIWCYLHLSQVNVQVGQVLSDLPQGGNDVAIIENADNWRGRAQRSFQTIRGRDMGPGEFEPFIGQDFLHLIEALEDDQEANQHIEDANLGKQARTDNWPGQIYGLQDQLRQAQGLVLQLNDTVTKVTADDTADKQAYEKAMAQVADLTSQLQKLTPQAGDLNKDTNVKVTSILKIVKTIQGMVANLFKVKKG